MTLSTFQRIYQEYLHSRLSVRDFCANQGFAPSTFYYWKKQLGATRQAEPDCFVPLLLDAGPTETEGQHSYVPATSSGNKTGGVSNAPIEFVFPNGTKMVIRDHADIHLLWIIRSMLTP